MKLFHFLKCNKLFAVLLAAELAVLCTLIAGLFGAPYKLTLTPDLFENRFPDIAAEDADGLKVWNQIDFRSEEPITFSSQGQALRAGDSGCPHLQSAQLCRHAGFFQRNGTCCRFL